jgi:hypothetical protein
MKLTGGCLCGAVRYEVTAQPQVSIVCYCRQCQQITGTGHAPQFGVPRTRVVIGGPLKSYGLVADSGNKVTSAFCGDCGCPVSKASSGYGEIMFIHAGTLDSPETFKPTAAVWVNSRQPWDRLDPDLPVHGG